jgi:threonine 3-dehydrogenase
MEEVPRPEIGPNDVLVRIEKTAICGTDLHIYEWDRWSQATIPVPMVIGHEFFGIIEDIGDAVEGYEVGQRVSGEGHITCGYCRNCRAGRRHLCRNTVGIGVNRQGCFAEYLSIPAVNIFRVADNLPDEIGAIFDPLGNAVHSTVSFDLVGEDVLITGAGPIGIMSVAIAKHAGARHVVITDVNDYRLELAARLGATRAVNATRQSVPEVMQELGLTEGFDVGLEMSGNAEAFKCMLQNMNNGGRLALLGIYPEEVSIDWTLVILKGLILKGIYGREMFETWYKMASMLQSGLDIAEVITHRIPVGDYEEGFTAMRQGQTGKVILDWA